MDEALAAIHSEPKAMTAGEVVDGVLRQFSEPACIVFDGQAGRLYATTHSDVASAFGDALAGYAGRVILTPDAGQSGTALTWDYSGLDGLPTGIDEILGTATLAVKPKRSVAALVNLVGGRMFSHLGVRPFVIIDQVNQQVHFMIFSDPVSVSEGLENVTAQGQCLAVDLQPPRGNDWYVAPPPPPVQFDTPVWTLCEDDRTNSGYIKCEWTFAEGVQSIQVQVSDDDGATWAVAVAGYETLTPPINPWWLDTQPAGTLKYRVRANSATLAWSEWAEADAVPTLTQHAQPVWTLCTDERSGENFVNLGWDYGDAESIQLQVSNDAGSNWAQATELETTEPITSPLAVYSQPEGDLLYRARTKTSTTAWSEWAQTGFIV